MAVEIRPATADEMVEFTHVWATGLGLPGDRTNLKDPEQTLCAFENGKMTTTYRALPFTLYFNGKDVPAAGIADVSTLPEYRRRGYLRRIITLHFQQMYETGEQSIALLWASRAAIYRRYGYDFVTRQYRYRIERQDVQFTERFEATGCFAEVRNEDIDTVAELYHGFAAGRTGYFHRTRDRWQQISTKPQQESVGMRVLYTEAGLPRGYLAYNVERVNGKVFYPTQRITVGELVYLDLPAYYAIWHYLAGMDLIETILLPTASQDDPLPYLLVEAQALVRMETPNSTAALMGRIVNVPQALSQRGYLEEGRLIFEIKDQLCGWNEGRWEMEVSNGVATVKRTRKSPQLIMPVSTLVMLLFNYVNASFAERIGRLDVLEPTALVTWDRVMDTRYCPFCPEHF